MRRHVLSPFVLCLALSSCQPPTYDIIAHLRGVDLVFEARGSGSWPFRDDDGISAEWLMVRSRDEFLWAIELDPDLPSCKPAGEMPPFPLVYGRVPPCYREEVAAKPIKRGIMHRIDGEGFRSGNGLFRVEGEAINLDWDDVWQDVQNWPPLPDPRFPPGPGNRQPLRAEEARSPPGEPAVQPSKNMPAAPAAAERSATIRYRP